MIDMFYTLDLYPYLHPYPITLIAPETEVWDKLFWLFWKKKKKNPLSTSYLIVLGKAWKINSESKYNIFFLCNINHFTFRRFSQQTNEANI